MSWMSFWSINKWINKYMNMYIFWLIWINMKVIILGNRIPVGDWATSLPCCAFWLGFTRGETVANSWRHTRTTSWVYFVLVIFWGMANLKHSHTKHCLFDLFIHCLIAFISNSFTVIKNCHHHHSPLSSSSSHYAPQGIWGRPWGQWIAYKLFKRGYIPSTLLPQGLLGRTIA